MPASPAASLRPYRGRLIIPSLGPDGDPYDVAFRCVQKHDCKAADCPKYLFLENMEKRLYNVRALAQADDTIEICEGQMDAATLEACGLHAVGVAGVNGWKKHHYRLFQGFTRVRVWGDGDGAGKYFAQKVCNDVAQADVMMLDSGEDVNDVFVAGGREAVLGIAEGQDEDEHEDHDEWPYDSEPAPF